MLPRTSGKCGVFHISTKIMNLRTPYDVIDQIPDENLKSGLEYLLRNNTQLIYGDLVVFDSIAFWGNKGVAVFDGEKLLNLEGDRFGFTGPLTLPCCMRVIDNDFPLDYWYWRSKEDKFPDIWIDYNGCSYFYYNTDKHGLEGNPKVWFNHRIVISNKLLQKNNAQVEL